MELKQLVGTLKMQRGRYAKKPNEASEKATITKLIVNNGGKDILPQIKEADEELYTYVLSNVAELLVDEKPKQEKPKKGESKKEKKSSKKTADKAPTKKEITVTATEEKEPEYAYSTSGDKYIIDDIKKTCKRVYHSFEELIDVNIPAMDLKVYYKYLKDRFNTETVTFKKGKIRFRDYRISLTEDLGFLIEDIRKQYEAVETEWEGIPTPAELGDWFEKPISQRTTKSEEPVKETPKKEEPKKKDEPQEEVDLEKCRKKVLNQIRKIVEDKGATKFNPEEFPNMIPFKRWRRKANSLLTQWKKRDIRYGKFLKELARITEEETFVIEEKNHRSSFKGAMMPDHKKVGYLRGDKIEVDDKLVDAVPFLLDYLLHEEPRAMSQAMKYARGEITDKQFIEEPILVDWKEEYHKRSMENTAHNARVLTCVFDQCGIVAPQDLLYEADLNVGDVILLLEDGEFHRRTIAKIDMGIEVGRGVGLLKTDKWILAPKKK